jgi:hypothetical protein
MYNASSSDKSVYKNFSYISLLGKYLHTVRVLRAVFNKEGHKIAELQTLQTDIMGRNC